MVDGQRYMHLDKCVMCHTYINMARMHEMQHNAEDGRSWPTGFYQCDSQAECIGRRMSQDAEYQPNHGIIEK